jgi:hypothetical protein
MRASTGSRPTPPPRWVSSGWPPTAPCSAPGWKPSRPATGSSRRCWCAGSAFNAWLGTEPFTNPDAPPGPGYLPEYRNPQTEQANQLNEKAASLEKAGTEARHTAEEYVRATVLFALVLFLVAVGQRFRLFGVRIATIALALALFTYGFYDVVTLPRI